MPEDPVARRLRDGLMELAGETADESVSSRLLEYLQLLLRWNRAYNLTAVTDPAEMVTRHLLDSLSVLPWLRGRRLLDAGTGAGLPGVPLAIARPELPVVLLDSAGKKIRFLNEVKRNLGLENIEPVQARLESFEPDPPVDEVITRAFSSLGSFARSARHLAPVRLLAMKGRLPRDELEALPPGVRVDSVEELAVPGLQEQRHLVIMSLNP